MLKPLSRALTEDRPGQFQRSLGAGSGCGMQDWRMESRGALKEEEGGSEYGPDLGAGTCKTF